MSFLKRIIDRTWSLGLLVGLLFDTNATITNASLVVDRWTLSVGVIGPDDQESASVPNTPINPLVTSHSAVLGSSTAYSAYNFVWDNDSADFRIDVNHQAEDSSGSLIQSRSSGNIRFSTTQDLLLTVEAPYTYDMPSSGMDANMHIQVLDRPPTQSYFNGTGYQDTFLQWPLSGTINAQGQSLLPGGQTYDLSYGIRLNTRGTSGLFATGSGYFHFTLQPIPEPSTLALALLGTLFLPMRRRR